MKIKMKMLKDGPRRKGENPHVNTDVNTVMNSDFRIMIVKAIIILFVLVISTSASRATYLQNMPLTDYSQDQISSMENNDNSFSEIPEYAVKVIEKYLEKKEEKKLRILDSKGMESNFYAYTNNTNINGNRTIADYYMAIPGEYSGLVIRSLEMKANMSIGHEMISKQIFYQPRRKEIKQYAINLDSINFTNATYTTTAQGSELWKCKDWNFTLQSCLGIWQKIMDIYPGMEYSIELYPGDPAFVEVYDTDVSVDIDMASFDDETIVITWIDGGAGNFARWQAYNTNGSNESAVTDIDVTGNTGSKVGIDAINYTDFALGIIDQPTNTSSFLRYNITGTIKQATVNIDVTVGSFNDISICELGLSFVVPYTDHAEGDADMIIRNNDGSALATESFVDGNVNPGAAGQNLVSCSALNVTHFIYAMFDDGDNDATIAVRNNTAVSNTNMLTRDLDTDVGETGQVDSTPLADSYVVIVYYDSTDDDISYNITRYTNVFTNIAGGDIDQTAGTSSRVAVATIKNESNYLWVAVWYDQTDGTIEAEVRSDTGAIVTPTFNISTYGVAANQIVAAAGYNPRINTGLCNGTFAVAYSNTTGGAVFETYWSNGSRWDGYCPESNPPNISLIYPTDNMRNTTNRTVLFKFNVTDQSPIVNCSLYINGISNDTNYSVIIDKNITFLKTFQNGEYNWSIQCTDYFNNTNMSVTYNFNISAYDPEIKQIFTQGTIILNAGGQRTVQCNATVEDNNGLSDIISVNSTIHLYNTSALIPNNNNTRYANSSCAQTTTHLNMSNYTCTFIVQYYATNGTWFCNFTTRDTGGFIMNNASNISIAPMYALNLSNLTIDYGDIQTGSLSTDKIINITNFGNMPINITVRGFGGDDEPSGVGYAMLCTNNNNITIGNQRYSKTSSTAFASKVQLTSSNVDMNFTIMKQSNPATTMLNSTYWQLYVPPMGPSVCNGTIVITAGAS